MTKAKTPPAPKTETTPFIAALDDAMIALLQQAGLTPLRAGASDGMQSGGGADAPPAAASLADKVKVFEVAAKWADQRARMAPPPVKPRARVDEVREQFHRSSPRGGGTNAAAEDGDE